MKQEEQNILEFLFRLHLTTIETKALNFIPITFLWSVTSGTNTHVSKTRRLALLMALVIFFIALNFIEQTVILTEKILDLISDLWELLLHN